MLKKYNYILTRWIYGALGYQAYYSLSFSVLDLILSDLYKKWNFNPFNYYEFGTGGGNSLRQYLRVLRKFSKHSHKDTKELKFNIFLFDSFEGLPGYENERDRNPAWEKGQFAGSIEYIRHLIEKEFPSILKNVRFFKGYFEQTLTEDLRRSLKEFPPSFVNIDVDYYTSCKLVLDFIGPILQEGTIIYFDDIFEYLGNPEKGELLAIKEFNNSNKIFNITNFRHFNITSFVDQIYVAYKLHSVHNSV